MPAKEKYIFFKIGEEDLPTASEDQRGQVRVKPHSIAEQGDRLMLCRMQDDGTTIAWANLTGVTVQESDVTVGFGIGVLDFGAGFTVTESPADEANIDLDLGTIRSKIVVPHSAAQSNATTTSTTSTTVYQEALHAQLQLPTEGTWRVTALGGLILRHSAGGTMNHRLLIDGTPQSIGTQSASVDTPFTSDGQKSSIAAATIDGGSGIVHIFVEYKALAAGTVNARNPWLWATAIRTA